MCRTSRGPTRKEGGGKGRGGVLLCLLIVYNLQSKEDQVGVSKKCMFKFNLDYECVTRNRVYSSL